MHFHLIRLVSWPNGAFTHKGVTSFMKSHSILCHIQLNEFETDPYFLQLSPNMATNCLFTFVFFPRSYLFCDENCFVLMFRTIFGTKQVNSGKNGEKHKSKQTMACHVLA